MDTLTNIIFINGHIWDSPIFEFFDEKVIYKLMQINTKYYNDIDNEEVWKHQLTKKSDYELKFMLFNITQKRDTCIKVTMYKDILKIIKTPNFLENQKIYEEKIINVKNNRNELKQYIIDNFELIMGMMFDSLSENIVLTMTSNQLLFNYNDSAKKLLECYTEKYEIKNYNYAFYIYNRLENYEMAVKYIDFDNKNLVKAFINLLERTKIKSNIDQIIEKELENIFIHPATILYIAYIYYIDERYNDVIYICKNYISFDEFVVYNDNIKIVYILYLSYKNLLLFDEAYEVLEKIIKPICLKINEINVDSAEIFNDNNEIVCDYLRLIKYYDEKNDLKKLLDYSVFFVKKIYPTIKSKINDAEFYILFIWEILLEHEYSYEELNMYCDKQNCYCNRFKIINAYINEKFDKVNELIKSTKITKNNSNIIKYAKLIVEVYNNNDYKKNNKNINNMLLKYKKEYQLGIFYLDIINDWINGTNIIKMKIKKKIDHLMEMSKKYKSFKLGYRRKKNLEKISECIDILK